MIAFFKGISSNIYLHLYYIYIYNHKKIIDNSIARYFIFITTIIILIFSTFPKVEMNSFRSEGRLMNEKLITSLVYLGHKHRLSICLWCMPWIWIKYLRKLFV